MKNVTKKGSKKIAKSKQQKAIARAIGTMSKAEKAAAAKVRAAEAKMSPEQRAKAKALRLGPAKKVVKMIKQTATTFKLFLECGHTRVGTKRLHQRCVKCLRVAKSKAAKAAKRAA